MKYFIDTEFLEGSQKRPLGKTLPTIDLISIGIVSEDGREYYAISKDFNLKEAWNRYDIKDDKKVYWIRENVLLPIYLDKVHGDMRNVSTFCYSTMKAIFGGFGKTRKQIAEEICQFIDARYVDNNDPSKGFMYPGGTSVKEVKTLNVEFYAYYADYDWVAFCWLYGMMKDLPKGFPMYCRDLKQMLDEKVERKSLEWGPKAEDFDMLNHVKTLPDYPLEINSHNALADARWNHELYKFINRL